MENILEVRELTKRYEKTGFSLEKVTFSVPYGAIMGLVGENGAGKTTTIGCILNTLFRDGGEVRLFGKEMTDSDTELREDLGVVFDAPSFSEQLDAMQLARVLQGVYARWEQALFLSYLEKLQIPRDRKIKTLSRGMAMKLSIAAALSHRPKLLILDEATSGLDPIVRDEILDVFLDFVQDERHSVLFSSHITSDLEKIADYITFIHGGKVMLSAKKDDFIYDYAVARCKAAQLEQLERGDILALRRRDYQTDVLMKNRREMERKYKGLVLDSVCIDDIMLLLAKGERT